MTHCQRENTGVKQKRMKTRGVLFDLYGTLIIYGEMEKAWDAWCNVIYDAFHGYGLTMPATEFRSHCSGFFDKPEPADAAGEMTVVERRLHRLAQELKVAIPRREALQAIEQALDVWHDYVRIDPDAVSVLTEIGSCRSVALVSNFDYAPYVYRLLTQWELGPLFDRVLVSDAVGVKKPHPGIFEEALRQLNLQPTEVMHVGDSQEDIDGATRAGIRPVWIDRSRKDRWRAQPQAEVVRIGALTELLPLLD